MNKLITALGATAAAAVLAACGGTVGPTITITAAPSSSTPTVAAETPTPTPEPSTPDMAEIGQRYQQFTVEMSTLMGTFADQATAGLVDDAADTLEELGAKAQEGLDLPDIGLTNVDREWDAAMNDYITAARIGVPAIRNMNASGMNKATAYIQKGSAHITTATTMLQDFAASAGG